MPPNTCGLQSRGSRALSGNIQILWEQATGLDYGEIRRHLHVSGANISIYLLLLHMLFTYNNQGVLLSNRDG